MNPLPALRAVLSVALAAAGIPGALAQSNYPSRPVRGIVAFATGGQSDIVARIVGQKLSERWNQSVVIENRPGASGNIGTEAAVKSPPDGYTLYFPTSTLTVNTVIAPSAVFDPMKDLAPISLTGLAEAVLVVPVTLPVKSVQELIAYARANPGLLNYGTTSIGASGHIGVEQLKSITGIRIELVSYTSIANLLGDLMAERVSVFIAPPGSVLAHVQSGKLRALGVSGNKRLGILPDVPAITETVPDFRASSWYAVMAPARTPADILARVNSDTRWVLDQADVRQRMLQSGVEAAASSPDELRAHMLREVESIEKLVQRGALKRGQ